MTTMPAPAGNDHYDVLVVGSGPGGATTAARVAETGRRVLLLERGDFLPRERDNWSGGRLSSATRNTPRTRPSTTCTTGPSGPSCTTTWAATEGVRRGAFPAAARGLRRGPASDGVAPAWPLSYDDLEPYYDRAEHLFWVHGQRGEDSFAGMEPGLQYPPVRHEHRIQQLSDVLEQFGLHRFTCRWACSSPRTHTAGRPRIRAAYSAIALTGSLACSAPRPMPNGRWSARPWPLIPIWP